MVSAEAYKQAKRGTPRDRQAFLECVGFGPYERYVSRLAYHDRDSLVIPETSAYTRPPILTGLRYKGVRSTVHVFRPIFFSRSWEEIAVTLLHEGMHAKDNLENPLSTPSLLDWVLSPFYVKSDKLERRRAESEVRTLELTLRHISESQNISDIFRKSVEDRLREYRKMLG